MDIQGYREEIKARLGADLLDIELEDSSLDKLINASFREVQRYITTTKLATIPYYPCIDLSNCGVSSVSRVYRTEGYLGDSQGNNGTHWVDPMQAAQWQLLSGSGDMSNLSNWILNYASWNTMLQIKNTMSTDLAFKYDKYDNKLYINVAFDKPKYITIEFVPLYKDVSEVVSDYWIDVIMKMAIANIKIALGRIRTRFTQSNPLWTQDGETLLTEGKEELQTLREHLIDNSQLVYPID